MKERIDHMTYLPGMEDIGSELMDQVLSAAGQTYAGHWIRLR